MKQAQKSLVTSLVLLVVAAGAGAFAWFGVFQAELKETERKDAEAKAFAFETGDVKSVRLTARGETIRIERDGEHWLLVSPVTGRAEKSAVEAIVNRLSTLRSREVVAEDHANLAEFGLDAPLFEVVLGLADGGEVTLKVGDENPFDQSNPYVVGGDERVHLADAGLRWPLDKSLFDLRDRALVTHEDREVQTLALSGRDLPGWSVERDGKEWKLTTPVQSAADRTAVESILSRVRGARASGFIDEVDDLARFGLADPARVLVFGIGEDRAKKTLALGQAEQDGVKKAYARLGEGPVLEIDFALLEDVAKTAADLRDKTVAKFEREKLRRLEILPAEGEPIVVHRSREKKDGATHETDVYRLEARPEAKVRTWKLSGALYTLATLKGLTIAAEEASPKEWTSFGLDRPRFTYVGFDGDGAELVRLLVGGEKGERVYVARAGSRRVFEVERTSIDDLPRSLDDLIDPPEEGEAGPSAASDG